VKVSRQQAAAHRQALVDAAARLFRERGVDGVGVAEIGRAAGLTHGGLYAHFPSKDALAAAACAGAFADLEHRLAPGGLGELADGYLSPRHRDRPDACPMATLAADATRGDATLQASFAAGLEGFAAILAERLPEPPADPAERRARALALAALLVGALSLARATAGAAPGLSDELLAAARRAATR